MLSRLSVSPRASLPLLVMPKVQRNRLDTRCGKVRVFAGVEATEFARIATALQTAISVDLRKMVMYIRLLFA